MQNLNWLIFSVVFFFFEKKLEKSLISSESVTAFVHASTIFVHYLTAAYILIILFFLKKQQKFQSRNQFDFKIVSLIFFFHFRTIDCAKNSNHKTLSGADVFKALEELELEEMTPQLQGNWIYF